jgi:hypothetical protein
MQQIASQRRSTYTRLEEEVSAVSTSTLGFAVAEEDRPLLDELVAYFGNGNRSAYLRATLRVMRSVKLAEELRELQAFGQTRLAEEGLTIDDIPEITRRVLKGRP